MYACGLVLPITNALALLCNDCKLLAGNRPIKSYSFLQGHGVLANVTLVGVLSDGYIERGLLSDN